MSERKPYPTDLTDRQWALIAPLLLQPTRGRRPQPTRREMINALLYMARTGLQGRMLPYDLPPREAVYAYWRSLMANRALEQLNDALRVQIRLEEDREADLVTSLLTVNRSKRLKKGSLWTRPTQAT